MAEYSKITIKAICQGLALNIAPDLIPQNKFLYLQNIRVNVEGVIESRPQSDYYIGFTPSQTLVPHSIKTIVNKITGGINRISGVGTNLFTGSLFLLPLKLAGLSGDPLTIVDFRPEEATEAYAYIGDRNKIVKVSASDVLSDIGITAPTKAATFIFAKPTRKTIDNITAANIGDWNHLTGSAGVPTAEDRVNTTIVAFLLDNTTPGFASIIPMDVAQIGVGAILTLNGADDVYVERLMPATLLASVATVSKISYDIGTTGLAIVVLSVSNTDIERDSILYLNSSEYVRVIEVTRDQNNIPSIRVKTVGTIANGQTVVGKVSFRSYVINSYSATQTITAKALKTVISASGISSVTKTLDIDLTNADGRVLNDNDTLHFSIRSSDVAQINEIQLQLDNNNGAQNFTDNTLYYVISPNFLVASATQTSSTLSTLQQALQREDLLRQHILRNKETDPYGRDGILIDDPANTLDPYPLDSGSSLQETSLGLNQWTEVFIRIGDLLKQGGDNTRTKKDIKAIRLSINAKAAVDFYLDSIWVGGGNELNSDRDVAGLLPYNYIWRIRDKATKAPSNWSPPMREGIEIIRGRTVLTFTDASIDYSQTDNVIDIARFGGTLNDYRIIGTIPNDASTFTDEVSDRVASQNDPAGRFLSGDKIGDEEVFDFYKPFCFLDTPKYGTCSVIGTKFTKTAGDNLNTSYPRGTQIKINGKLNQLYTNPSSTTQVELEKDMGSLTGVKFEIIAPLLTGQPLPILFGTFGEGSSGLILFGVGNKKSAGTVYWLDPNSPDTMSDLNFLEITSPSEVLLVGGMYDGYPFVFTNKRSFMLSPTYGPSSDFQTRTGLFGFVARENANSRGVFSPYSICFGRDFIYFLPENADGIYRVPGNGNPECITDGAFSNLFIRNGVVPSNIVLPDGTIIYPPDFTKPSEIRLFDSKDFVQFRYIDTNNQQVAFVFDKRIKDWISYDKYFNDSINAFYEEELESTSRLLCGIDGAIGIFAGTTPREDSQQSRVYPFFQDGGDFRTLKQFNEIVLDIDRGIGGFTYHNIFDNSVLTAPIITIAGAISHKRELITQAVSGSFTLAKNIATYFNWTLNSGVKFYGEMIYFLPRADQIIDRPSDSIDGGVLGEKYWQGFILEADTFGLTKVLKFTDDEGNLVDTISINHTGKETKAYSFTNPFIAHSIIRSSNDGVSWIFYQEKYEFNIEPEKVLRWEGQATSFGIPGFKIIPRVVIVLAGLGEVTFDLVYDDGIIESYLLPVGSDLIKREISFFLRPRKGKIIKPILRASSIPFRLYLQDCEFYIKGYNDPNDFQIIKPFGQIDYDKGVKI